MQVDRSRVGRHLRRQIHHLLFRPFTGVGRRVKIDRIDLDAPLGNHPPGHRRINTAGQKQHRLAACAYRHTARPRNDLGIDIDLVPNLHMQKNIRLMHVHSHFRKSIQDRAAQLHIDLHGIKRIILSGASGRHLKTPVFDRIDPVHIVHDRAL